jgi:hypothetical protein
VFLDGDLYLVDKRKGLVYQSERDEQENLVQCGIWDAGKITVKKTEETIHPWKTEDADHCETPPSAYKDIAPVLRFIAKRLEKKPEELRIYDPYYCAGGVKRHLAELGFTNVYNECEDFYAAAKAGKLPEYDVLVTNPPYSMDPLDHIKALMHFVCLQQSKPWLIVQPNFVYTKPYWEEYTAQLRGARPFFLTPPQPRSYVYTAPKIMRLSLKSQQLKTSPFVTMWYCWLGRSMQGRFFRWWVDYAELKAPHLYLAGTEAHLPDAFKDSRDKTRRKLKRKRAKGEDHSHDASGDGKPAKSKKAKKKSAAGAATPAASKPAESKPKPPGGGGDAAKKANKKKNKKKNREMKAAAGAKGTAVTSTPMA